MVVAVTPPRGAGTLVGIQYLRGAAATLVVLEHLLLRLVRRGTISIDESTAPGLGYIGVTAFFAISGFIMVYTTYARFGEGGASRTFLWRRMARILPLYYVTSVLIVLFLYSTQSLSTGGGYAIPSAADWVRSALFIPYYNEGLLQPIYTLGWTLQFEMLFYAVFALCLRFKPSLGIPLILIIICGLVFAGLFIPPTAPGAGWAAIVIDFYTSPILAYFVMGMVLALVLRRVGTRRLPLDLPMSCAAASLALLGAIATPSIWQPAWIALALLVVSFARSPEHSSLFSRSSSLFGEVSYSLYLTHSFALGFVALAVSRFFDGWLAFVVGGVAGIVICVTGAWFVWRFAEKPVTDFLIRTRRA